jgi:hypothetical protein
MRLKQGLNCVDIGSVCVHSLINVCVCVPGEEGFLEATSTDLARQYQSHPGTGPSLPAWDGQQSATNPPSSKEKTGKGPAPFIPIYFGNQEKGRNKYLKWT